MTVNANSIGKILAETFGQDAVRVCSTHHLQVKFGGLHNVYLNASGKITLHRNGMRRARPVRGINQLIEQIQLHDSANTDLAHVKELLDLAKFIGFAKTALPNGLDCGVFVDAGWKDGIASIAIVEIRRDQLGLSQIAQSWHERTANSHDAEIRAIEEGLRFNSIVTVFSDCQNAVLKINSNRVVWIPREQNKLADKLGNMRLNNTCKTTQE